MKNVFLRPLALAAALAALAGCAVVPAPPYHGGSLVVVPRTRVEYVEARRYYVPPRPAVYVGIEKSWRRDDDRRHWQSEPRHRDRRHWRDD